MCPHVRVPVYTHHTPDWPTPDQLALRAGNEKEEGETADTVGCCSLRVEHIQLYPEADGCQHVVELDFLGKDSIRYYNRVPVERPVSARARSAAGFREGSSRAPLYSPFSSGPSRFSLQVFRECERHAAGAHGLFARSVLLGGKACCVREARLGWRGFLLVVTLWVVHSG